MELALAIAANSLVGLDSSVFIYLYEKHPLYYPIIQPVFERLDNADLRAITSIISLIEVLVLPKRQKRLDLVSIYTEAILHSPTLTLVPLDVQVANRAAELRANYNLRTPDAIQVATAIEMGAQSFITNDVRLKMVGEIAVLAITDFVLP